MTCIGQVYFATGICLACKVLGNGALKNTGVLVGSSPHTTREASTKPCISFIDVESGSFVAFIIPYLGTQKPVG
jgi:hypothetical protein